MADLKEMRDCTEPELKELLKTITIAVQGAAKVCGINLPWHFVIIIDDKQTQFTYSMPNGPMAVAALRTVADAIEKGNVEPLVPE